MSPLETRGWQRFPRDPELEGWLMRAGPAALSCAEDPGLRRRWLRHGATWFAGVNVLENDASGAVAGSGPLRGAAVRAAADHAGPLPWDRGQVSVVYPGYPGQDATETDAAHRFRRDRDAAHVDGLLPVGPARRRMIREPHAVILGLPLSPPVAGAAPLVVWEGSPAVMRQALTDALAGYPEADWSDVDVTEAYQAARREAFRSCKRVEILAGPGEAYLLHRLALHGVAPWTAGPEGARAVLYFRPAMPGRVADWLAGR